MSQMQRLGCNFDEGAGMHEQLDKLRSLLHLLYPTFYDYLCQCDIVNLFFAYRWLLLDFKREFAFTEVLQLWETIWSRHRTHSISLFIALAVIDVYGLPLVERKLSSDQVLEFFNSLANHMDVSAVLRTMRAVRRRRRRRRKREEEEEEKE